MFESYTMVKPDLNTDIKLNTIEEAIDDIKQGKIIIVVDDEDRENEGDFICAAEKISPEIINFMATHGRGLICTPIEESKAKELKLPMMVPQNTAMHETAFTVSIDLIGHGCTTGISAYDRATCIKALVDPEMQDADFARPGHIFPLIAKDGGVLRRTGHTEAAIDLTRLAGLAPAGVLVEILNEDGTMARLPQLARIARKFELKMIAIKDLVAYRMKHERLVQREISVPIETKFGQFEALAFSQNTTGDVHIVLKKGDWNKAEPILVKTFSQSGSNNILDILINDYGKTFDGALEKIAQEGRGLVMIMRHSENNSAILDRLKNFKANLEGKPIKVSETEMEQRDFGVGAQILTEMGIAKIKLLTNSPKRRIGLIGYGLEIVENVEI